ncbi:HK97 gp10 family phage protein [Staphylococcus felis]|uniref:HK97 gp10 family phage protein n=1 Tax=Staphylococcus felis TaxID=46127 RepID=A0A3E0IKQ9_9STAP|nr:HK97 gp10 family phage protein [Staphylococcus felis]REH82307.1 HK97 gp10 family phage protein [Staphylococcus felis]REH87837.1 HK97 gp10 family phage protein [Staphylococcus felis]REH89000.1 HK97 gp10 family phage protein [Staphylococcus felis]REI15179.1 HK97 gp10 family phage protein [Staphylococcus felis]REI17850.1 HK97 gp10 family phage protein [Staphylococcus felis]
MPKRRHIDVDNSQVKRLADKVSETNSKFVENLIKNVDLFGMQMEDDSKALAPVDSRDLEQSINSKTSYSKGIVSSVTGSNLEYALRRHEEQPRIGKYNKYHKGVKYKDFYYNGRGELTRAKENVNDFQPGRKYLTNASLINRKNWNTTLIDSFKESWR